MNHDRFPRVVSLGQAQADSPADACQKCAFQLGQVWKITRLTFMPVKGWPGTYTIEALLEEVPQR
jgi:hypothetical protein